MIERAEQETALPKARLQGETARTCGQLRLFAQVAEEGSWVMARVDRPDAERKPAPKPDLRSMLRPLGPVVVFGASNFPLAFSVAGGDTASALAAGCPVIVKAHSAHPGTSELVGQAVQQAVRQCNLPEGVFSLLFGRGAQIGVALMKHPLVKAGGFTGSRGAGRQLMDTAAARPEPIPFYAEMSSTNPVFILPGALQERAAGIASGLHASFTLGAGQFCTKPGMVFLPEGADAPKFVDQLRQSVDESAPFYLLTGGIRSAYQSSVADRKSRHGVSVVAEKSIASNGRELGVGAALFETDGQTFLKDAELEEEIFGPATLLVRHANREQMLEAARNFEGHLTATIHGTEEDLRRFWRFNCDPREQSRQTFDQWFSNRSGGFPCHGAWRTVPFDFRWAFHLGGQPGDLPFHAAHLLPEFSRRCATRGVEKRKSSSYLAHGGWRDDQRGRHASPTKFHGENSLQSRVRLTRTTGRDNGSRREHGRRSA